MCVLNAHILVQHALHRLVVLYAQHACSLTPRLPTLMASVTSATFRTAHNARHQILMYVCNVLQTIRLIQAQQLVYIVGYVLRVVWFVHSTLTASYVLLAMVSIVQILHSVCYVRIVTVPHVLPPITQPAWLAALAIIWMLVSVIYACHLTV